VLTGSTARREVAPAGAPLRAVPPHDLDVAGGGATRSVPSVLDSSVAARFRDGDPDAVRAVYREYGGLVHAVAHRVLGDRGLAEEATQQAFVQAWRAAASFDPGRELGPWLATIARRVAIDVHRREARRASVPLDDAAIARMPVVVLPDSAASAHDVWEVREALAELPPEERDVVRLQHLQGLTQAEVASALGIPIGTVKSRSVRAYRRLAARLGHLREGPVNRDGFGAVHRDQGGGAHDE
jgi:RNA polymerase sigma factor (sigma-70 family)